MLSYEMLRVIWWVLLGVLLIGFAIMDGYDFGCASLLPFLGKKDSERRVIINAMGPYWEGNQVWLVLGGGAVFAAWPHVYAVAFSGFYFAILILLALLIIRPICFTFRNKHESEKVRKIYDGGLFISGLLPPILTGVAVGNIFLGADFAFDNHDMSIHYQGFGLFELLHPFAILCGLVALGFSITQGAVYLVNKADDLIAMRAKKVIKVSVPVTMVLFIIGGFCLPFLNGFQMIDPIVDGPSNPLLANIKVVRGAWAIHLSTHPYLYILPAVALIAMLVTALKINTSPKISMIASSVSIFGVIATAGCTFFPFIVPSSLDPSSSLTVWNASSSQLSLNIMFYCVVLIFPFVLLYTAWVIRVMRGKVTIKEITEDDKSFY